MILQWTKGCRYLFKILIFTLLETDTEVGLLSHTVILLLIFCSACHNDDHSGRTKLHSHQLWTTVPFSTASPTLVIFCLLDYSCSNRCEVMLHHNFDLTYISLMSAEAKHLFLSHWPGTAETFLQRRDTMVDRCKKRCSTSCLVDSTEAHISRASSMFCSCSITTAESGTKCYTSPLASPIFFP